MENKFHFVLIKNKACPASVGRWYLVGDSIETICRHFKKYVRSEIKEGIDQMLEINAGAERHYSNSFGSLIAEIGSIEGIANTFQVVFSIKNQMLENRIKYFLKGVKQYLTPSLTVFLGNDNSIVIDEVYKDTLVYPHEEKPTINDVRFLQWENGNHWYAKIGKIDIVDENGKQKWNTMEDAKKASLWFIKQNYNM